eukprot:591287-Amphidinium_carterae.1
MHTQQRKLASSTIACQLHCHGPALHNCHCSRSPMPPLNPSLPNEDEQASRSGVQWAGKSAPRRVQHCRFSSSPLM